MSLADITRMSVARMVKVICNVYGENSIMIPCLQKIYPVISYQIDNTVLLGKASGPSAGSQIFKWFRLTYAAKRVAHDCFNKVKGSQSNLAIRFYPVAQVFAEFRLEYGVTMFSLQGRPQHGAPVMMKVLLCP